jgi:hypothetical protein
VLRPGAAGTVRVFAVDGDGAALPEVMCGTGDLHSSTDALGVVSLQPVAPGSAAILCLRMADPLKGEAVVDVAAAATVDVEVRLEKWDQ